MAPQPAALVALVVALLSHPVLAQQAPQAVRDLNPGKLAKDHLQPFTRENNWLIISPARPSASTSPWRRPVPSFSSAPRKYCVPFPSAKPAPTPGWRKSWATQGRGA